MFIPLAWGKIFGFTVSSLDSWTANPSSAWLWVHLAFSSSLEKLNHLSFSEDLPNNPFFAGWRLCPKVDATVHPGAVGSSGLRQALPPSGFAPRQEMNEGRGGINQAYVRQVLGRRGVYLMPLPRMKAIVGCVVVCSPHVQI